MKKAVSIIMVLVLAAAVWLPAQAAMSENSENLPVVFIGGRGSTLIDAEGNRIYPLDVDIKACAKIIAPGLLKGQITNNYDDFGAALSTVLDDIFGPMKLDGNGNVPNGSGTDFTWSREELQSRVRTDSEYDIFDYVFYYDWRLDPFEIADSFAQYIDDVLAVTGAEKVRLIGRCMGGNIVEAYLQKYGNAKIDRLLMYVTTANGTSTCGAAFAGEYYLDCDAVDRFAEDLGMDHVFSVGSETVNDIISEAVTILNKTQALDFAASQITRVYWMIADEMVADWLLSTFATYPSYWSMVGDDYYEAAKRRVFTGKEAEYAGLIAKIDNYHTKVQQKSFEIMQAIQASGTDITVIAKYGEQHVPVTREYAYLSDNTVELYRASFGASCTLLGESFDENYMKNVRMCGKEKYVSPDGQVDCSTCLYPDHTWVVKNCAHSDFPGCIDDLMREIMRYPGRMTVNDNPKYPQYLVYDKQAGTVSPMSEDNCDTYGRWNTSLASALVSLSKLIFDLIIKTISESLNIAI